VNQLRRATALLLRRLRLDLRGPSGHLIRLFGAAMLLITILTAIENSRTIGSPGLAAFRWIVWCDALLISVASITVFASVIAGEREGGTLGLLRMTGTSPMTLLLGQGMSGILIGCLLLAVQLPFIVLTITLGGILWNQVQAAFLALLAHLVLSAGIGLFCSTLCKRSGSAAFYTLLIQMGLWMGPWGARRLAGRMAAAGTITIGVEDRVDSISSFVDGHLVWTRLGEIAGSFGAVDLVAPQFWFSLGAGGVLFLLAALLMDSRPIEVPPSAPLVLSLWKASRGRAWDRWPIPGKDFRQFMGGRNGVVARLLIYIAVPIGVSLGLNRYANSGLDADDVGAIVFWCGLAFLTIELNAIASRLYRNELAEQTWSTLTLLPESFLFIVRQKLMGAALGLLPGLLVVIMAGCSSDLVQEVLARMFRNSEGVIPPIMVLFFVSATSLFSMTLSNFPPTVLVFCGLIAFILHYMVTMLAAVTLQNRQAIDQRTFAMAYAFVWSSVSLAFLIVACVRLRKLTERN